MSKGEIKGGTKRTTKQIGDAAEERAWRFLQSQGFRLLQRNYRTPGRGGGEIDLIVQDTDATMVFVEVRLRTAGAFGGACASVTWAKQRRIVFAARHYLLRCSPMPACRFDVVVLEGDQLHWYPAAFDAG